LTPHTTTTHNISKTRRFLLENENLKNEVPSTVQKKMTPHTTTTHNISKTRRFLLEKRTTQHTQYRGDSSSFFTEISEKILRKVSNPLSTEQ
jgi:hypothetical protein